MKLYKRILIFSLCLLALYSFLYPLFYTESRFLEFLAFFGIK